MATSSDSKVIQRDSLTGGLIERYEKQRAGGAYYVQQDVKVDGTNSLSVGDSSYDKLYTINKGFKIKQGLLQTEFKDCQNTNTSAQLSLYVKGLDTRRYRDSKRAR